MINALSIRESAASGRGNQFKEAKSRAATLPKLSDLGVRRSHGRLGAKLTKSCQFHRCDRPPAIRHRVGFEMSNSWTRPPEKGPTGTVQKPHMRGFQKLHILAMWREATTGKKGRPSKENSDNVTIKPERGNSRAYTLDRLRRERRRSAKQGCDQK
jgi:hypothetical protein